MLQSVVQHDAKSKQLPQLLIADDNNSRNQHTVIINKNMLWKLFTVHGTTFNLDKAEENQIKETLLDLNTLKVSINWAVTH